MLPRMVPTDAQVINRILCEIYCRVLRRIDSERRLNSASPTEGMPVHSAVACDSQAAESLEGRKSSDDHSLPAGSYGREVPPLARGGVESNCSNVPSELGLRSAGSSEELNKQQRLVY